jgi:hypothetical protein
MITDQFYIENFITTNEGVDIPFRWTHGATIKHMGDGLLVYSIIQHMRAKVCVCIGSGGGFIPRIMTQARMDLWEQQIFERIGEILEQLMLLMLVMELAANLI